MHDGLSNSKFVVYTCDAKRFKPNLNKSYLWHCRIGHINKNRIAKLQANGILESTGSESFDVCESCLSRKMTKAPFTGQGERAKDLLGLIHTDVCGLLKPCQEMVKATSLLLSTISVDMVMST